MSFETILPKSKEAILEQVKQEIKLSRDFVLPKRTQFRDRLKLYNNQRKQRDKIGDTTLYNIMNTLLAVYYSDELQVGFTGRDISDLNAAANLENLAKFDHDEMDMDVINYLTQWDRFFFGVGIRVLSEWDERTKTPVPKSMDALAWLPDPAGALLLKNFRFMGFEVEYLRNEMTEDRGFYCVDELSPKKGNDGSEMDQTKTALREAQNLSDENYKDLNNKDSDAFNMVDWFTIIVGEDGIARKYFITVDEKVDHIVRCEEIMPITDAEKEEPIRVPFPVSLNYYSPTRSDPFGTSVCDLVEDKQRAKSVIKNLRIAIRKAQLYPMYLYNRDKIINRRDLDFAFNKFIGVRGDVSQGVIQPINQSPARQVEAFNDEQSLDADVQVATGADRVSQGVVSVQDRTATEINAVLANANVRFLLGARINAWGDKDFWMQWYRMYKQNFKAGDKKMVRLKSAINTNYYSLKRKDFITKEDPDIEINSKLENEQKQAKERIAFMQFLPIINADPSKPIASKRFNERHALRLHGFTQDLIDIMSPQTPDEMRANMENELLSNNEIMDVDVINEDHLSHMLIHSQAEDTDARNAHIEAHRMAYLQSGQSAEDRMMRMASMQNQNGLANNAQNQISNMNTQLSNNPGQPSTPAPVS